MDNGQQLEALRKQAEQEKVAEDKYKAFLSGVGRFCKDANITQDHFAALAKTHMGIEKEALGPTLVDLWVGALEAHGQAAAS